MKEKYKNYLNLINSSNHKYICSPCGEVFEMFRAFTELYIVKGSIIAKPKSQDEYWEYLHWWLTDLDNNIIDPCVEQFFEIDKYIPKDKYNNLPTGKCYDCGSFIFNNENFCNIECEKSTMFSLQGYYMYRESVGDFSYYVKEYQYGDKEYEIDCRNKFKAKSVEELKNLIIKDIIE